MTEIRQSLRETYAVQYGDRRLQFHWLAERVVGRKARIHVYPNGMVEVETPENATLSQAKQALLKRAGWVARHLGAIEERQAAKQDRQYVSGETIFYLGRRHVLKVISASDKQHVKLVRGRLQVTTFDTSPEAVKASLARWYRKRAHEVFARRLLAVSAHLPWVEATPPWSIRLMSTQWGSCSPSGKILLNPHLVKAPTLCIDYVILHELCHLQEHNHSANFYRLLKRVMPDWEKAKSRLDELSELYLNQ